MHLLYNLGVHVYGFAIRIASLFNPKAKKWQIGRRNLIAQIPDLSAKNVVWFHCASLGEFDQGLPLMNKIKAERPNTYLLVTFFSPSGFEHYQKREHQADYVCYLPLDTPSNARRFLEKVKPKSVFFIKYEFWANYILTAKRQKCKIYNVSGLFRENHRFFKWYGSFFRTVLNQFEFFFVQNEASRILLDGIGIPNVLVTGDSRFDRVIENSQQASSNELIQAFKGNDSLLIVGSSWPADESLLAPWMNSSTQKILIAPHQIDDKHISQIQQGITRKTIRFTQATPETIIDAEVLILDTIGLLSSAYKYGEVAYVGGGFSGSLHNILEPAVFGLPVIFGPNHTRFPEAQEFIDQGFGFSVSSTAEFEQSYKYILNDLATISEKEKQFVSESAGATERILAHISSN
ncbi:MAG: 3-deoxy-D-manno-octulosonic-acid transferase [Crocinitomicaceae bacterium]|jgi:3-deoxy-D-manno-octulosonic-acid transferase